MSLSPEAIKIVLLVTLLISTFVLSMLPLFMTKYTHKTTASRERRRQVKALLSLLSCYAAGVFLATCLLDLFPDAHEKLSTALLNEKINTSYPVTESVVVFGFLIIFLIEQIILHRKEANAGNELSPLMHESVDSLSQSYTSHDGGGYQNGPRGYQSLSNDLNQSAEGINTDNDLDDLLEAPQNEVYADPNSHSIIRALMLLLALSFHSVFEGLAVGLQETTDRILAIFLPVALHKSILAFALGLNLTQSKLSVRAIVKSNIGFAITSPVGIAIGILICQLAPQTGITDVINGIIQGLACGTFLFVVFFEILPHEFMGRRRYASRLMKTMLLVLGYATVAGLLFLDPDAIKPDDIVNPTHAP